MKRKDEVSVPAGFYTWKPERQHDWYQQTHQPAKAGLLYKLLHYLGCLITLAVMGGLVTVAIVYGGPLVAKLLHGG